MDNVSFSGDISSLMASKGSSVVVDCGYVFECKMFLLLSVRTFSFYFDDDSSVSLASPVLPATAF